MQNKYTLINSNHSIISQFAMLFQTLFNHNSTKFQFSNAVKQQLLDGPNNSKILAARAIPSKNNLTRWIIIYQNSWADINELYFKLRFTIQDFELPVDANGVHYSLQDRINKKTWYVTDETKIYEILKKIKINPAFFTTCDQCNYPFLKSNY